MIPAGEMIVFGLLTFLVALACYAGVSGIAMALLWGAGASTAVFALSWAWQKWGD